MRQIVSLLIAVAVFAATFILCALVAPYTLDVEVGDLSLKGSIPGLVLAAAFAVLSYRGGAKG